MASMQEYCEMLSTTQLQALLREEYSGTGNLPVEGILTICSILAQRVPSKPSLRETLRRLCESYL